MQKFHSVSKRALAMLLALAMMLPMFTSLSMFGVVAIGDEDYTTKTNGQVVAENYDLTEAEKALLESGYLIGATHDYEVPNASDDLISVDIERKTITMKNFKGSDGSKWKPVSADIVVGNNVIESIKVNGNVVSYETDSSAFAVKVKYEFEDSINESVQELLLNAADILKSDMDNLDALLDPAGDIQKALDKFASISMTSLPADGLNPGIDGKPLFQVLLSGYKTVISIAGFETTVTLSFSESSGDKDAALKVWEQLEANGGKLNLAVIADEYAAAQSKVKFLVDNAERIMNEAANTAAYMLALSSENAVLSNLSTLSPDGLVKDTFKDYLNSMTALAGNKYLDGALDAYATADAWKILSKNPIKAGLTDINYAVLDVLVANLGDDLKGPACKIYNPLVIDSTVIQYNMSMYNVTVKVALNTLVNNEITRYGEKSLVLTFAEGATEAEILAAIKDSGIEADALAAWGDVFVDGKYNRAASNLPGALNNDVEYLISYNPKSYKVNFLGEAVEYQYGYQLYLPTHAVASQAYDYTVNGAYYAQGTTVTITDDTTITRSEGKAYTSYPVIDKLVVDNFFAGNDDGTKKAVAILTSGALNTIWNGVNVDVRLPESDGLINIVGNKLTAGTYASSYKGLDWVPYSYTVNGNVYLFNGESEAIITEAAYDSVEVEYRLTFTDITGIQSLLDIPGILAGEADSQISALEALNVYYAQMGEIGANKFALSVLATAVKSKGDQNQDDVIEDPNMAELYNAINGFSNNCFADNSLKIYNLMSGYREGGLAYYYTNSAKFTQEIDALNSYLVVISKFKEDLKVIVAESLSGMMDQSQLEKVSGAIDRIDELGGAIETLKRDLKAPNALIDLESDNLDKLTRALESEGTVPTVTEKPMYLSEYFVKAADGKVSFNIKVQGATVVAPTFTKGHLLTQDDINNIVSAIENKMAQLAYSDKYYTCNFDRAVFDAMVGKDVADVVSVRYEFYYTINQYEVFVEGVASSTVIDINNLTVVLPASDNSTYRYEYIIFGKKVSAKSYTFSHDEFDKIIKAGGYVISRVAVDVKQEEYSTLVNNLNKAVGSNLVVFALTEKNGEYSIVMKIDASNPTALMGAFTGMMAEFMKHDYVAFDDNAMIYTNQNGMQISLQALLDTVYDSGFGSDTLIKMMTSNGSINNMAMPGKVVSDKAMSKAGALVAETELCLGTNADELKYQLPMYITVGAVPSQLVEVRNLFANTLSPYFAFKFVDGEIALDLTLPQKAYEAYIGALLVTDTIDLANINALNEQVAFGFMKDLIDPLLKSGASVSTIQNTLAKFGYNIDLSGYERAFELVRDIYLGAEFTFDSDKSTYDTEFTVEIDEYIEKLNLGIIGDLIAEKGQGITFPVSTSLKNLDDSFEAIYFDVGASGVVNKFGFVEDISAKLNTMSGTAVVILLKDISDSLAFNTTTLLNLNGFDVNGNIIGRGNVVVVDNNANGYKSATVAGKVSGNVTLTGGKYTSNVSAYIPSGYVQNADGVVAHKYINIVTDGDKNFTINVDASLFKGKPSFDYKSLAVDVALELLFTGFTNNQLYVNDELVYSFTVNDLIGIYTAKDRKAALINTLKEFGSLASLNALLNTILDDVADFDALKAALEQSAAGVQTPLFSYDATIGSWGVEFDYNEEDDTVDVDIVAKKHVSSKLSIALTGSKADLQYFADLVGILADTTDADVNVNVGKGAGATVEVTVDGFMNVDFSGDPAYTVLLGMIVADGIGASANSALVLGLKDYFDNGDLTALENAFHKVTFKQLFTAVRDFDNSKTVNSMLNNIGLAGYYSADAAALEAKLHRTAILVSKVLNKFDIDGYNTAIGNFFDEETNAYVFSKENLNKVFAYSGVKLDAEITSVVVTIKLFAKDDGPVEPPVDVIDYSALEAEIAKIEAEDLIESDYTATSWARFAAALAAAKKLVAEKNATTQKQVLNVLAELILSREALKLAEIPTVDIDYSALAEEIAKIEAECLVESDYTSASWARLQAALDAAKKLVADKNAESQDQVDTVLVELKSARAGLEKVEPIIPVDYSALEAEIAKIEAENLVESDYTSASWARLQAALDAAKKLVADKNAESQEVVDAALVELKSARAGLTKLTPVDPVVPVDYTALKAEIARAEALNEDDYTTESWKNLLDALKAAHDALKSESQTEVDNATAALRAAIDALQKKQSEETESNVGLIIAISAGGVAVGGGAGAAAYFTIRRKRKLVDSTPLVDIAGAGKK